MGSEGIGAQVVVLQMGQQSLIVALNVCIAVAAGWIALRYWHWVWTDRHRLRQEKLGALPLSVALLTSVISLESAYYTTARILKMQGIADLWLLIPAVLFVRAAIVVTSSMHLIPLWRSAGVAVAPRVIGWTALLCGTWAGLAWWLW